MDKVWQNAGVIASATILRPQLDWGKMSEALGGCLKKYSEIVSLDKASNPNSTLRDLAVSMQITAKQILRVFMAKFSKGHVKNRTLRLTYSYLAASHGEKYRHPAIKTMIRHVKRILEMPNSFIRTKFKSQLEHNGVNCIALEIDPRYIYFKDQRHQKLHEQGTEILLQPRQNTPRKRSIGFISTGIPFSIIDKAKPTSERTNSMQSIGGLLNSNFGIPFD